jgi:hypothetical protein
LVDGRCFFLDADNRCRIHTEIAYEAKPAVCRAFPLTVLQVGDRLHARLSFWCPTVVENAGRPLDHQTGWLKETAKSAGRRTAPLTIDGVREISLREFDAVHHALRRLVATPGVPMKTRLAAGAGFLRRLHSAAARDDLLSSVREAEGAGPEALAREGAQNGRFSSGRRVLTLFLLNDRENSRWSSVSRFLALLLFHFGGRPLRCQSVGARASWRAMSRVVFAPGAADLELLSRYFCSKLDSRRYVAGDVSLVKGFNLLLAGYAMVELLARARAADGRRAACDHRDISEAVAATDLLVVEHVGLDRAPLQRQMSDAALGGHEVAAGVLATLSRLAREA